MTIICALHDKGRTFIGADSQAVNDRTLLGDVEKWIEHDGWAVGVAGNYRTHCLLCNNAESLFKYIDGPGDFVCRVRDLLKQEDYNTDNDEGPKSYGQNFILAHSTGVWSVCTSFSVVAIPEGRLWADGSGRELGVGAGNLEGDKRSAGQRVRAAVYAATSNSTHCGGQIMVRELK